MENNFEYYFIITLANKEKNLHKIRLKTNKDKFFGFLGFGKDDELLKSTYEIKLEDNFDAFVFACHIPQEVKEFMIYLESDLKITYNSKVIKVKELRQNNKELVFFNFNLKFENSDNQQFSNPPMTSNINYFKSFLILRTCFLEKKKKLSELYEFSLNYINKNLDLLVELMNSIKEQKMEKFICLLINKIDFKFLLSELKSQNKLDEFKKILDDRKIESMLKNDINTKQ